MHQAVNMDTTAADPRSNGSVGAEAVRANVVQLPPLDRLQKRVGKGHS